MIKNIATPLALLFVLACAAPVLAATDPTVHQIYEAAQTGHLDQAQLMVNQVLRDHPQSAKAHYVAAEIYARARNPSVARRELNTAQQLAPGLPFAKPEAVRALQRELSGGQSFFRAPAAYSQAHSSSFPWGIVLALVVGVGVLWAIMRRRTAPTNVYSQYPSAAPNVPGAPGYGGGPGYGPGYGPNVGGGGSGILGSLATGAAVGAGVVAGEELARHVLDGNHHEGNVTPTPTEPIEPPENNDMGGPDFGVSDGDSWDDSGGGGGGGGDDWT